MDNKINLDKMIELLNAKMQHQNKDLKEYECYKDFNNSESLNVDMVDICIALSKTGKVSGYSNTVKASELFNDIIKNISEYDLQNAKSMVIMFSVNPNMSMFVLSEFMDDLHKVIIEERDIVFGTSTTTEISEEAVGYRILLTGII